MKKLVLAGLLATVAAGSALAAPAQPAPSQPGAPGHRPLRIDLNGDGIVTVSELEQSAAARFHKLDANGDGNLTRAELEAPRQKWLASHPRAADRAGDPQRKSRRGDRFARLDADHNGAVSFAEFSTTVTRRAERLDANHDGQITREEFTAARQAWRNHRGGRSTPSRS